MTNAEKKWCRESGYCLQCHEQGRPRSAMWCPVGHAVLFDRDGLKRRSCPQHKTKLEWRELCRPCLERKVVEQSDQRCANPRCKHVLIPDDAGLPAHLWSSTNQRNYCGLCARDKGDRLTTRKLIRNPVLKERILAVGLTPAELQNIQPQCLRQDEALGLAWFGFFTGNFRTYQVVSFALDSFLVAAKS